MTGEEAYLVWAPADSPWARWVKPVLFSFMDATRPPLELAQPMLSDPLGILLHQFGSPPALVLDLCGPLGVAAGLEACRCGWRPVPLYNALPGPPGLGHTLVEVWSLVDGLLAATPELARVGMRAAGPPAFLLDANRRSCALPARPGLFDNRSLSLPGDFPSTEMFRQHGVSRVAVVYDGNLRWDLLDSMQAWVEGGLEVFLWQRGRSRLASPWKGSLLARLVPAWRWVAMAPPQASGGPFGSVISGGASG